MKSEDEESMQEEHVFNEFSEKSIRRGFLRKVYGILMCQLLLTAAIVSLLFFVLPIKTFIQEHRYVHWVAFAVAMVCLISMACFDKARRKAPTNFIFLGVFTMAEGFMLGAFCTKFNADSILIAVGITCGVTLALTLFAMQTKIDFTAMGGVLLALLMILFISGLFMALMGSSSAARIGYGAAGALIFSLYIVYDTQLMMGGNHRYSIDPEEYVFAALNLYLDIINLFMYILTIISEFSSN